MPDYRSVIYRPEDGLFLRSMGYEDRPEYACWGPGCRDYCILHYVTSGRGYFCGREVCAGEGFYIHAGQLHEYHSDERDGWNYFWISLSEELAKQYVLPYIDMDEKGIFRAEYAVRLPVERQKIFAEKRPMKHLESLGIFFSILAMHEAEKQQAGSMPLAHLSRAKAVIENSFARRLSVGEVAREIAVDDRYLYNLFRQYEGISVKEYIDRCAVKNACALLTGSDMSVSQIAQNLGFEDVYAFSKFFRKRTGISPTRYRAQ